MPGSCSHWWHAPIYAAATAALVFAAISSTRSPPPSPPPDAISALLGAGFHVTAAVFQISPAALFPSTAAGSPATLFAFPDGASFANLTQDQLFRLHTVPLRLPLSDLRHLPRGSHLSTLLPGKTLLLSTSGGAVVVGGATVTHPDLFVSGPHVIHGVSSAFRPSPPSPPAAAAQWAPLIRRLGEKGYVSFAVGLNAVTEAATMAMDATVFAPAGSGFDRAAGLSPKDMSEMVRRHVAVGRYGYRELSAMAVGEGMLSLAEMWVLRITDRGSDGEVLINGVELMEPELYVNDMVVVHGIAEPLVVLPHVSR